MIFIISNNEIKVVENKNIYSNYKEVFLISFISLLMLLIRISFFDFYSGDMIHYLEPWMDTLRKNGGFLALKREVGNYNMAYMYLLALGSYLPIPSIIYIKLLSVIADFLMALFSYKIIKLLTKNDKNSKIYAILGYFLVIASPTVFLNSSVWGQCDSIYTLFILISIYFYLSKRTTLSFIFLGISFSFKLQAIFILPAYILMFLKDKDIRFYHFLIIPLVNIISLIPANLLGRPWGELIAIYFSQTGYYKALTMNMPNLYTFISFNDNNYDMLFKLGILGTLTIFAIIFFIFLFLKFKCKKEDIILIGILGIMICVYFLPGMHDRYMYTADVLVILYCLVYRKQFFKYIAIPKCL